MYIRREEEGDYAEINVLVKQAFASAEQADGHEQDLVRALRLGDGYIQDLTLVAEKDDKILGHIMFTKARVGRQPVLVLAPLSVHPAYQKQGIGGDLIQEGHRRAKALGYNYSLVLGSESYYPRFGYVPASTLGIRPPFDVADENFMVCKLREMPPRIGGLLEYAKEFGLE